MMHSPSDSNINPEDIKEIGRSRWLHYLPIGNFLVVQEKESQLIG